MKKININDISVFVFDFDGVLTNNYVYMDEDGKESVRCNRADGLAFDALRKLKKIVYILSTEKNKIVTSRARKLKVKALQGVTDKLKAIRDIEISENCNPKDILYVGNDINDYHAMERCGTRVCPIDSHLKIKKISNIILNIKGGDGVVRELLEKKMDLDLFQILYRR
mgnify:CR=1 FL=1